MKTHNTNDLIIADFSKSLVKNHFVKTRKHNFPLD